MVSCDECGAEIGRKRSLLRSFRSFCDARCQGLWNSKHRSGENHPQWAGGRDAKYARVQADPTKRLRRLFSNQVWWALNGKKNGHCWEGLVGYSIDELRAHLARQLTDGMTWDNYGEWHIDHIVPVSAFEFDSYGHPDFIACFALSNLRPLWGSQNISKGNRRTFLL